MLENLGAIIMSSREKPVFIPALAPPGDVKESAALIFIHGLGDDAAGLEGIARQFQGAHKLDHMQWVIPNALDNRDAMQRAWYTPSSLSIFPSQRPELDDPEDEDGLLKSREYIVSLIDDLVGQGVPADRIVLGGFSQGCAMSLLTSLTSKYSDKLAGVLGLAGYMPLADQINRLRDEASLLNKIGNTPVFLMRGSRDVLVPKRYLTLAVARLTKLGVQDDALEVHEYEGLGHGISAAVLRDMCVWLEKVVPRL